MTQETEDVVARLRKLVIMDEVGSDNPLGRNAIKLIEKLSDRIDVLSEENDRLKAQVALLSGRFRKALDDEISALTAAHERMQEINQNDEANELYIKIEGLTAFRAALHQEGIDA